MRATPRRSSGGGAGSSTRVRRGAPPCRGCRRRPAPRRGAVARGSARGRCDRRRRRAVASRAAPATASGSSSTRRTMRMPLPPPPAAALMTTGKPRRCAASANAAALWRQHRRRRHDRHARPFHERARRDLVAHGRDRLRRGTDEGEPGVVHGGGEARVLGEEAVAGMDGVGAARGGRGKQLLDHEIALASRRRPDRDGLVGEPHVRRIRVGLGVDGDARDPHRPARADDADGDLTAVGDQDSANGGHRRCGDVPCTARGAHGRGGRSRLAATFSPLLLRHSSFQSWMAGCGAP